MSVFDLFRRFFEPGGRRDPFFGGMTQEDDDDVEGDDDDENVGYPFGQPHIHDFGFSFGPSRSPFSDSFGFEDFFRDFNELFADFGAITRGIPELPGIEPPPQRPEGSGTRSLRDHMLKYPDSHLPREQPSKSEDPSARDIPRLPGASPWGKYGWGDSSLRIPEGEQRQDKDLDSEVSSQGLDTILRPAEPRSSSCFQSVSVSRVTRPDGTVEERRTVRDGQGNTSTTVTIHRGDQIIRESRDPPHGSRLGDHLPGSPDQHQAPLDLSDSQTVLSRIFQRWFSQR
ncbi:HCLS1-associated protein X-1-like isoform 2-T2 [Rhinophrynus dorsalis]